jgi:hypothetical protein
MLEKVVHPRCPLDELALLEFIQLVAELACVLRMRDEEKKDVMKKVVCHEEPDDDRRRH